MPRTDELGAALIDSAADAGGGRANSDAAAAFSRPASPARQADVELAPMHADDTPVVEWPPDAVASWARATGIDERVVAKLERHEVDGDVLLTYSRAKTELRVELELSVPEASKLHRAIQRLAESEGQGTAGGRPL